MKTHFWVDPYQAQSGSHPSSHFKIPKSTGNPNFATYLVSSLACLLSMTFGCDRGGNAHQQAPKPQAQQAQQAETDATNVKLFENDAQILFYLSASKNFSEIDYNEIKLAYGNRDIEAIKFILYKIQMRRSIGCDKIIKTSKTSYNTNIENNKKNEYIYAMKLIIKLNNNQMDKRRQNELFDLASKESNERELIYREIMDIPAQGNASDENNTINIKHNFDNDVKNLYNLCSCENLDDNDKMLLENSISTKNVKSVQEVFLRIQLKRWQLLYHMKKDKKNNTNDINIISTKQGEYMYSNRLIMKYGGSEIAEDDMRKILDLAEKDMHMLSDGKLVLADAFDQPL